MNKFFQEDSVLSHLMYLFIVSPDSLLLQCQGPDWDLTEKFSFPHNSIFIKAATHSGHILPWPPV